MYVMLLSIQMRARARPGAAVCSAKLRVGVHYTKSVVVACVAWCVCLIVRSLIYP